MSHFRTLTTSALPSPKTRRVGQESRISILRIDAENKKIGLSARAASHDEPITEQKIYTSEAGGGMASLAELADLGLQAISDDERSGEERER